MSKNLKKEYQNMMLAQTPDLWNRIENGLQENRPSDSFVTAMETDMITRRVKAQYRVRMIAGMAACLALFFIAIPVIRLSVINEMKNTGTTNTIKIIAANDLSSEDSTHVTAQVPLRDVEQTEETTADTTDGTSVPQSTQNTDATMPDSLQTSVADQSTDPLVQTQTGTDDTAEAAIESEDDTEEASESEEGDQASVDEASEQEKTDENYIVSTADSSSDGVSAMIPSVSYNGITVSIQSTLNDGGDIYYRAKSSGKDTTYLLQITDSSVGKFAEKKTYTISMQDSGSTASTGEMVYDVIKIQ